MGQLFQFSGIGTAEVFDRKRKLKPNFLGTVELNRTEVKRTRQAGDKLFVEFTVRETNMPQVHPVGDECSWGQKLLDGNVANGALKRFLAAVAGVRLDDKEQMAQLEQHMDNVMNNAIEYPDRNQLIGRLVRVETTQIKTKENRDFILHTWMPY